MIWLNSVLVLFLFMDIIYITLDWSEWLFFLACVVGHENIKCVEFSFVMIREFVLVHVFDIQHHLVT